MADSGIYLRVERAGKFEALDITDLTVMEIHNFFQGKNRDDLIRWIAILARLLRERTEGEA